MIGPGEAGGQREITLYDPATRRVVQVMSVPHDQVEAQLVDGLACIDGAWRGDRWKIHPTEPRAVPLEEGDLPAPTYAQRRASEYPDMRLQLDALWKAVDALARGAPLPEDARAMCEEIEGVKRRFPKA